MYFIFPFIFPCKSTICTCTPVKINNFLQTLVEQARGMLETIDGVTTVHGRFYELCSNYHKVSAISFQMHHYGSKLYYWSLESLVPG